MNKLRAFSYGGGALLVALTAWAALRYGGSPAGYVEALALGALAVALPAGTAYAVAGIRSLRRRAKRDDADDGAQGVVFVSETTVGDPIDRLEAVADAVRDDDAYDGFERGSFDRGPGLTVAHDGFHESLVRITEGGRVVVTGASVRTRTLVDTVARACSLSFERTQDNPFRGVEPVRGGPRVFLALFVLVAVLAGVNAVSAAAYPGDAYNPAERTVLMSADARADLDPGLSPTDARLRKASFLVRVVDEEATEVRWEGNDTARIAGHGRQALRASSDARTQLSDVVEGSPTPAQAARARRIASDLREAERSVAAALDDRAASDAIDDADSLRRLGDRLRTVANASLSSDGGSSSSPRVAVPD